MLASIEPEDVQQHGPNHSSQKEPQCARIVKLAKPPQFVYDQFVGVVGPHLGPGN